MNRKSVNSEGQTVLLISNDTAFCGVARGDFQLRRADVRVSSVGEVEAALLIMEKIAPSVILLAEEVVARDTPSHGLRLDAAVRALGAHAPVVVLGNTEFEPRLAALVAAGAVEYVARGDGYMNIAMGLLEMHLAKAKPEHISENPPSIRAEAPPKDFGEVLRHELNNPLTGILGNAELLLADIIRKNDGRLPAGGQQRVETIATLAVRLRETVRQLSQEWEARQEAEKELATSR
jgi:signal transduction histidine kinase